MSTLINNLYPPVMPDAAPAFIRTSSCKIYFSLSIYNSLEDIKNVQISLVNQTSNKTALKAATYPSGIKIVNKANFIYDSTRQDDYKYYITIAPSDLTNSQFEINQYYLVQLRFTDTTAENPPASGGLDTWLSTQKTHFSEWSSICLIKGIQSPTISFTGLNTSGVTTLSDLTKITGRLSFSNTQETEYLKSYNINIYETSLGSNNPTVKTQEIYTNSYNPNEFIYNIPYDFNRGVSYTIAFTYTTNNGYIATTTRRFQLTSRSTQILDGNITITPEEENGRIKFDIDFENGVKTDKNLIIKRSSSRSNFKFWETIKTIPHTKTTLKNVWYDTTIESGVWYKYRAQQDEINGTGRIAQADAPIICIFEDIFITSGEKQLKVQFNPTIGDFRYNTMESQQVTLGGKYPFVKRNGNNYFRSFSIGGLISAFMDDINWYGSIYSDGKFRIKNKRETFSSPFDIYGETKNLYANYNSEVGIDQYQDYIYEREFRQKVSDFLYKNDVKLFRSLTEGNILIKLQNVAFQPIDSLGRRLYSFTATAIEIDDFSIENFVKYNIINKYYYAYKVGTISDTFVSGASIISDYILKQNDFTDYNTELLKIFRLDITLSQTRNAVFYLKTINDSQLIRYETSLGYLNLKFDNEQPIEECYFYGIHLNPNQYTLTNQYYHSTSDVPDPTANKVYYIYFDDADAYRINNYIEYDAQEALLITTENEVERNSTNDYALFVEGFYEKYIYYNNNWYRFTDNGDVLMGTQATITYYYEIKEAN